MNLPVAGVMHQPEIREVVRPTVTLGPHVVDVDLFPIVQSLVADRAAPVAYSTDSCHPVHRKVATQSTGKLPPNPQDSCHPVHGKAATWTTGRLPPTPGEACHRRSSATPGLYC
jgi:hypothetical protein